VRHDDGVRQAFVDEGPFAGPFTFVLLHGNPTWSFLYRHFIARLSTVYRVIAVDHVGFGRSDKPEDPGYYTIERHIANLDDVLDDAEPGQVVLVLHDWGGPIGMGWAVQQPERIAGIVVLNTFAFVQDPPIELPWLFRWLVLGPRGWNRVMRKNLFVELFLARGARRGLAGEDLDPYRAPFSRVEDRTGMARFPRLIPETANRAHESWRIIAAIEDALPRLRHVPALACWAERDRAFRRPVLDRWLGIFDYVDGPHLLPDAGHVLQEDEPEVILDHIERWARSIAPERDR